MGGRSFRFSADIDRSAATWFVLAALALCLGLVVWWTAFVAIPMSVIFLIVGGVRLSQRRRGRREAAHGTGTAEDERQP